MSTERDANRVLIFDTTLRDGEQSPGISLNTQEKLEIAQQLARLGVDVIEAGFPITSPGDFEAVQEISRHVEGPVICALARTAAGDVDRAWEAVRDAERPRIHTFIATSDLHIQHKLQTTREDVLGQARAAVAHAKQYTVDDSEYKRVNELIDYIDTEIKVRKETVEMRRVSDDAPVAKAEENPNVLHDVDAYLAGK